ncbi:hypothetical protein TrLO_g11882 [Triparma laevis f. longispina]|uniref:gamma-glutamylcyclotransferase n=1 Tax=Triparma laevis f. longispina TaxID=1714387 RepID=A0A9W7FVM9_9STRA|nr:hypothetical protein TrLO_g11882 [Triparma laevis f. longispina]
MNIDIVTKKKGVTVLEHTAGSVSGYSLSFTTGGLSSVEPSFGDCQPQSGGEIHGVALKLTNEDMNAMDAQEGYNPNSTKGYKKIEVTVNAYDGRTFLAWVYSARQPKPVSTHCSQRYLNVLISGAKDAGLDPEYIEKLSKLPTYTPTPETLALRSKLPPLSTLPSMTVTELAETKNTIDPHDPDSIAYTSIHGYIFRLPRSKITFGSHLGRDLTARFSRHFRGISMDLNDDLGKPPFRLPRDFESEGEREYVRMWRDHYLGKMGVEGVVVACLKEYTDQLEEGEEEDDSDSDECLLEMLGLPTLSISSEVDSTPTQPLKPTTQHFNASSLLSEYKRNGYVKLPIKIPRALLEKATVETTYSSDPLKTYETIRGEKYLTRCEKFIDFGDKWLEIVSVLESVSSEILGVDQFVFKEKLNYKPPQGKGFAPHLDGPSLAMTDQGHPNSFITIMMAIDKMTVGNGCLEIVEGEWNTENAVDTVKVDANGNPDREGRPGEISSEVASNLDWKHLECEVGGCYMFSSLLPHKSATNMSEFQRRAVFITLSGEVGGREEYYRKMEEKRSLFKPPNLEEEWLKSVPK